VHLCQIQMTESATCAYTTLGNLLLLLCYHTVVAHLRSLPLVEAVDCNLADGWKHDPLYCNILPMQLHYSQQQLLSQRNWQVSVKADAIAATAVTTYTAETLDSRQARYVISYRERILGGELQVQYRLCMLEEDV